MDKAQLKRHDFAFISEEEKQRIWQGLAADYNDGRRECVETLFLGNVDIPGIVRRGDAHSGVPLGFVPVERFNGNRLRIAAHAKAEQIRAVLTPYEVLGLVGNTRTECMRAAGELYALAKGFDLQVGVLGSAGLELATGLPYTDSASDLDFLIKPANYNRLLEFYQSCQEKFTDIDMDFEVDFPNGFGVKLAEVFMQTRTVLGKSIDKVTLLDKKDIMQFLN